MPKYTKDYSEMTEPEKFYAAINDCKDYLGEKKFYEIIKEMRGERISFESFARMMGFFAGIEGYPVNAMYEFAYGWSIDKM